MGFNFGAGAKLPLYAFRKSDKVESSDKKEPPFAFLDSLLLGEVILKSNGLLLWGSIIELG